MATRPDYTGSTYAKLKDLGESGGDLSALEARVDVLETNDSGINFDLGVINERFVRESIHVQGGRMEMQDIGIEVLYRTGLASYTFTTITTSVVTNNRKDITGTTSVLPRYQLSISPYISMIPIPGNNRVSRVVYVGGTNYETTDGVFVSNIPSKAFIAFMIIGGAYRVVDITDPESPVTVLTSSDTDVVDVYMGTYNGFPCIVYWNSTDLYIRTASAYDGTTWGTATVIDSTRYVSLDLAVGNNCIVMKKSGVAYYFDITSATTISSETIIGPSTGSDETLLIYKDRTLSLAYLLHTTSAVKRITYQVSGGAWTGEITNVMFFWQVGGVHKYITNSGQYYIGDIQVGAEFNYTLPSFVNIKGACREGTGVFDDDGVNVSYVHLRDGSTNAGIRCLSSANSGIYDGVETTNGVTCFATKSPVWSGTTLPSITDIVVTYIVVPTE